MPDAALGIVLMTIITGGGVELGDVYSNIDNELVTDELTEITNEFAHGVVELMNKAKLKALGMGHLLRLDVEVNVVAISDPDKR